MTLTIISDNREKSSGVPALLAEHNIKVTMEQLYVGDYIIDNEIIIERKTNVDFVQSIMNGHLFNQCARLRKTTMVPLIIVEGNPYKTNHRITAEAIKGAVLAVSLSWQIPIFRSSGKDDTVRLMIMAGKQQINPAIFIHRTGKKPKKAQRQQHYLVQNMPGIGSELARRLLNHFSTIENIVNADIQTLQKVEGVGKIKANKLYDFLRLKATAGI